MKGSWVLWVALLREVVARPDPGSSLQRLSVRTFVHVGSVRKLGSPFGVLFYKGAVLYIGNLKKGPYFRETLSPEP